MRASRHPRHDAAKKGHAGRGREMHVSGAECLCAEGDCGKVMADFLQRALDHPRGRPDTVVITLEEVSGTPAMRPVLPFSTLACSSTREAEEAVRTALRQAGVSGRAVDAAFRVITSARTMRGASLVDAATGRRLEPDRNRGVRVSRLGVDRESLSRLNRRLARAGINTATVREALILASKVASCQGIVAEVCISDDPDYTTGYVASRGLGYLRVPHIKSQGAMHGGRVFFIRRGEPVERLVHYLEKTPVLLCVPVGRAVRKMAAEGG